MAFCIFAFALQPRLQNFHVAKYFIRLHIITRKHRIFLYNALANRQKVEFVLHLCLTFSSELGKDARTSLCWHLISHAESSNRLVFFVYTAS